MRLYFYPPYDLTHPISPGWARQELTHFMYLIVWHHSGQVLVVIGVPKSNHTLNHTTLSDNALIASENTIDLHITTVDSINLDPRFLFIIRKK